MATPDGDHQLDAVAPAFRRHDADEFEGLAILANDIRADRRYFIVRKWHRRARFLGNDKGTVDAIPGS
jgi:hypothetical protein